MGHSKLIRRLTGPIPAIVLSLLLVSAIFMLSAAAQYSEFFGNFYSILLLVNVLGIGLLLLLITANVYRLIHQFRARVLGSRLTLRLFGMFVLLAVIPLTVVYYFSVQFLNKGIDSWFDVRIEQALNDALLLGRTSLEAIKRDRIVEAQDLAARLDDTFSDFALIQLIDELREQGGFSEVTLFTQNGRIIASSGEDPDKLVPDRPNEAILAKLREGQSHANMEPAGDSGMQLRVAVPVFSRMVSRPLRIVQVLQPLPLRYSKLAESVQSAFAEYEKLEYLRKPLKFSFILTLSLVTLITLLIAVWAAIVSSRRLAAPLRNLAEGTRQVAGGDYGTQLPVPGDDEFGVLVKSFNDMTQQIQQAQTAVRRSQREAESQRTYLETVLAHLSSGVLSFDSSQRLRTHNATADQVLGVELDAEKGKPLAVVAEAHGHIEPFFRTILDAVDEGEAEWQRQVVLLDPRGRRVLICRGTRLPDHGRRRGGYVVVFDEITALIQAQRDAAWAEVARRLAHEIKNPLTPIQLSAERIRHKYLDRLPDSDRETLDRATRTIAEQVESMKSMVNAFSSYAQPQRMQPENININQLIQDVAELHKEAIRPIRIQLTLDETAPTIVADRGRLRQILNNLIANSRDALHHCSDPIISLDTRCMRERECEYVELTVSDNGPGFPPELIDRLFEPYVTTKEKGNGLGLAIVKKIVDEHGGMVTAQNRNEGGACVTIRLPKAGARDLPDRSKVDTRIEQAGAKEKIA